jgi:hypothetical protein
LPAGCFHCRASADQKAAAKCPAQKVKATGAYDEKTKSIKVTSIEAENGAGKCARELN